MSEALNVSVSQVFNKDGKKYAFDDTGKMLYGWVKDGEIIFRKQEDAQGGEDTAAPSQPDSSAPAEE